MDMIIRVVNNANSMIFENELQKVCDKFRKNGYELEIQTHIEHVKGHGILHYVAVVIGRKTVYNPLRKGPTETKVDTGTLSQQLTNQLTTEIERKVDSEYWRNKDSNTDDINFGIDARFRK